MAIRSQMAAKKWDGAKSWVPRYEVIENPYPPPFPGSVLPEIHGPRQILVAYLAFHKIHREEITASIFHIVVTREVVFHFFSGFRDEVGQSGGFCLPPSEERTYF